MASLMNVQVYKTCLILTVDGIKLYNVEITKNDLLYYDDKTVVR